MFRAEKAAEIYPWRVPGRCRLFNLPETVSLYYNVLMAELCRSKEPKRQGMYAFIPSMAKLLLYIMMLSSAPLCAAVTAASPQSPPKADARVAGFIAGLGDRDQKVRDSSEKQLLKTGAEAIPQLLTALDSVRRRDVAVRIFNRMGCDAIDTLIKLLDGEETRTKAGSMLFQATNPGCAKYIGAYLGCMESPAAGNYCGAALVKTSGPKAKAWLPEMTKRLTGGEAYSRSYAAAAIGEMGNKASSAIPELLGAMKDPAPIVRLAAATAIGKTGVKTPAVRAALGAAEAGDPDGEVRRAAAEALKALK